MCNHTMGKQKHGDLRLNTMGNMLIIEIFAQGITNTERKKVEEILSYCRYIFDINSSSFF